LLFCSIIGYLRKEFEDLIKNILSFESSYYNSVVLIEDFGELRYLKTGPNITLAQ